MWGPKLLLTGAPGCGKTTVVRRAVESLSELRMRGFYSEEMRDPGGHRAGFRLVPLSGEPRAGETPLLATVALRGGGLIAAARARPDVSVVDVTPEVRDTLPDAISAWGRRWAM